MPIDPILRDVSADPVIDADWDEMLIDVSTPAKRTAIVAGWIDGCAGAGFDAIEIDNLDTFSRSEGLLTEEHAVATMRLFSDAAHARGLAIAQKNSAELVGRRDEMATDFVVAEEGNRYDECDVYTDVYGDHVLVIEYRRADFDRLRRVPGALDRPARPRPRPRGDGRIRVRRLLIRDAGRIPRALTGPRPRSSPSSR